MQPADEKFIEMFRGQNPGFFHIVPVPLGPLGQVRFEFHMVPVPAQPTEPQKQPQKAPVRKLRERSPR